MKKLILIALVTVAFAACTNSEVPCDVTKCDSTACVKDTTPIVVVDTLVADTTKK